MDVSGGSSSGAATDLGRPLGIRAVPAAQLGGGEPVVRAASPLSLARSSPSSLLRCRFFVQALRDGCFEQHTGPALFNLAFWLDGVTGGELYKLPIIVETDQS